MGIFNTQARLLLGKREGVAGVAEPLTSADGDVRVRNVELSQFSTEYDDESSKYLTGDHTRDEAIAGVARGAIDFGIKFAPGRATLHMDGGDIDSVEMKLPYAKYLEAAGLARTDVIPETVDGVGKFIFRPQVSADSQTMTVALYDKETGSNGVGIEYSLAGAMSTLQISSEGAGKPYICNFSLSGKVNDCKEVAHGDFPVFVDENALSTLADKMLNTHIRITPVNQDGSAITGAKTQEFCVNQFTLDTGCNVAEIMCQQDNFGILHNTITTRDPRITINPLLEKLSDFNFWKAANSESVYKFELVSYANSDKDREFLKIVAPRVQLINPNGEDDNGFRRMGYTLRPLRNLQGALGVEREWDYEIHIGADNVVVE